MGGYLAYLAAADGAVDAAVCYYGGGIQNALEVAPKIRIPILFHYGEKDAHIPPDAVQAVRSAFSSHNNARIETYPGVDHGFNCWGRPMYNQAAATLAHGRSLEWLSQHIS
jgi:carboxymethylenebutenolidase